MKRPRRSIVCPSLFALVLAALPVACGSDGQGDTGVTGVASGAGGSQGGTAGSGSLSGSAGRGGGGAGGASGTSGAGAAGSGASSVCAADAECALSPAATTPPGCAVGKCVAGSCRYPTVDADGDGFGTRTCKATGAIAVALGDDCDDTNATINPDGWDGPAEGAKADACGDGVDQDCSGKADDGKTAAGATCTCTPGDVQACDADDDGKPIVFPSGKPLGECRRGARTCLDTGVFGPCTGTVGPTKEECNDKDDDCDGNVDLAGDKPPSDATFWLYDQDDDLHAAKTAEPVKSCNAPKKGPCGDETLCPAVNVTTGKTHWREGLPKDDCLDTDGGVFPGATEVCNGKDDDCNEATKDETATGVATWFWDGDGDGFVADTEIAGAKKSCENPGLLEANCRGASGTCPAKWLLDSARKAGSDCDDADPDTFPGAWDGPATRSWGLEDGGISGTVYGVPPGTAGAAPGPDGVAFPRDKVLGTVKFKALTLDWGAAGPLPSVTTDYALELSGTLTAPQTGTYTIEMPLHNDYARVVVGGKQLFSKSCCTQPPEDPPLVAIVDLVAGQAVPLVVQLIQAGGRSGLVLMWSGPGVERQAISMRSPVAAGVQPDRCDGVPQNCAAAGPDATVSGAYACGGECTPGQFAGCGATYSQAGKPSSGCLIGLKMCGPGGRWGLCQGGVGPVPEVCGNGKDDNCDGAIDETNSVFYEDVDKDGFGDSSKPFTGCNPPAGYVLNDDDCGPNDPSVNPSRVEVCDGKDNDCRDGADILTGSLQACDVKGGSIGELAEGACIAGGVAKCAGAALTCTPLDPGIGKGASLRTVAAPTLDPARRFLADRWDWNCDGKITRAYPTVTKLAADCAPGQIDDALRAACGKNGPGPSCGYAAVGCGATAGECGSSLWVITCGLFGGGCDSYGAPSPKAQKVQGCF